MYNLLNSLRHADNTNRGDINAIDIVIVFVVQLTQKSLLTHMHIFRERKGRLEIL